MHIISDPLMVHEIRAVGLVAQSKTGFHGTDAFAITVWRKFTRQTYWTSCTRQIYACGVQ